MLTGPSCTFSAPWGLSFILLSSFSGDRSLFHRPSMLSFLDNQISFLILIPLHTHCQYIIVCGKKPFLTKSETENRQKSPRLLHSQKLPDCTTWEIRWARRNSLMFWMLCSGQGGISQISVFSFKPGFPVIPLAKRQYIYRGHPSQAGGAGSSASPGASLGSNSQR